jgi:formylglycine-generating enzyme
LEFIFNDPYLNYYMSHPAFSYYPLVGLSWLQIQNYLIWKTDRMNEAILIEKKIQKFNTIQSNANNFNTEAYLAGQYDGVIYKEKSTLFSEDQNEMWSKYRMGDSKKWRSGIMLPGFRLPTEAEWVYATQAKFTKPFDPKRSKKAFSSGAIHHSYGNNYFSLMWARNYKMPVDEFGKKGFKNNAHFKEEQSKLPQRLTSIADYNPKYYGVAAMDGNVKEWLLDIYKPQFDSTEFDFGIIAGKNGFPVAGSEILDYDGIIREKDSMGRMHFRTLGVDNRGYELRIRRYYPAKQKLKRVVRGGTWKNPGTWQRESMSEDSSSALVGFRCVMNYAGMPVNKKYKVKW